VNRTSKAAPQSVQHHSGHQPSGESGQHPATAWRCSKSRFQPQSGQNRIISTISDLLAARLSTMLARNPAGAVHLLRRVMGAFSASNAAAGPGPGL
jgi:hypothetical protein